MERKSMAGGAGPATDPLEQPAEQEGSEQPEQVAKEHGPAHEVHMQHNHEAGEHHVHSMHPDGHEHHSMHGSVEEAHEHAKKLAGAGEHEESDGMNEEEPEYE
jgi:hypothetical protein